MIYESNEQIRQVIKDMMKKENVTYDDLAVRFHSSRQNAYKLLNKNQLKLDDIKKFCEILGYTFEINITKGNKDLYDFYINDEFMDLIAKIITVAKDVDYDKIRKKYLSMTDSDE